MIPASIALSESRAKWISHAVVQPLPRPGASANPIATHRDRRSGDLRRAVVAGLLVKGEESPGILIVATGSHRSCPSAFRDATDTVLEFDLSDLVYTAVVMFRSHSHMNNVLTHLCGGQWERIGQALHVILNPLATLNDLSPLAQNLVELMCADRGITGRILKPYFQALLAKVLPPGLLPILGFMFYDSFWKCSRRMMRTSLKLPSNATIEWRCKESPSTSTGIRTRPWKT